MPLAGTEHILAKKIVSKICESEEAQAVVLGQWTEIAKAIIDHIVQNASVTGTATCGAGGGPLTPPGKVT